MYRTLDLFAGAGGLSLGFEMTGQFNTVAIVENNADAATTFLNNHKEIRNYSDILKLDFELLKEQVGDIDIIIGGPPCQGFSNANRQRRQLVNGSNELVKKFVEAIKVLKPKAFVMENVKTIASDKHFFCITIDDYDYLENVLKISSESKKVLLYEGSQVSDIEKSLKDNMIEDLSLVTEEELYILYNIVKKWNKLETYFNKTSNQRKVESIIQCLSRKEKIPNWLLENTERVCILLQKILENPSDVSEDDMKEVKQFWDVQRFYQGLIELSSKKILYQIKYHETSIVVVLKTYIVIDYVRKVFEHIGYITKENQLNAAMFGVPQTRERFIMIGIRPEFLKTEKIDEIDPLIQKTMEYVTVRDAIGDLKKIAPTVHSMGEIQVRVNCPKINSFYRNMVLRADMKAIYNHVCTETREIALARFKVISPGENFHALPESLKDNYENPNRTQNTVYRRLSYEFPSDTVVNVRKSMWIHPEFNRAISAREAARLQSFPDDYVFYGTKDSVYQQIGNAVPPLLGRAVAEKVLELLGVNPDEYETMKAVYESYR
jgi:DNA (cytosine-5)-methyltransferase 1